MTDIIFAHALDFKLTKLGEILTPGGIDNNYLSRFSDAGFGEIFLVSRSSLAEDSYLSGYQRLDDINPFFLSEKLCKLQDFFYWILKNDKLYNSASKFKD